ncbi:MAG: SPASM domain-containing protein, partial [Kiritimatiellia bacterium]|nr:SPASM domain-containing protein [Kiritimatiellia bacterium]
VGLCTVLLPGELRRYEELADYCEANDIRLSLPTLAAVGAAEDMRRASEEQYEQVLGLLKSHPRLSVDWAFSYFLRPGCPAGKEKIAITCYGDVLGCSLNHISFGNVKHEPLETIWRRAGRFSQFRKHSPRCLAAFDPYHIDNFLVPIARFDHSPVHYADHPNMTPESEPDLFER